MGNIQIYLLKYAFNVILVAQLAQQELLVQLVRTFMGLFLKEVAYVSLVLPTNMLMKTNSALIAL
jgi:hypothetical protein